MTRKERRAQTELRRKEILVQICEVAEQEINAGESPLIALQKMRNWVGQQIMNNPQEGHIYRQAFNHYNTLLLEKIRKDNKDDNANKK